MTFVYGDEYTKVLNENIMLKTKINEFYLTTMQIHESIKLTQLKEENEVFKQNLEFKFDKYDINILELKDRHRLLKKEMQELKDDVNNLHFNNEYHSFIRAIQDITHYQELQTKLLTHAKNFHKLRYSHTTAWHYIDEPEPEDLMRDRMTVLGDKLITMDSHVRCKFDKEFPNLIQDLINYIEPLRTIPTVENLETISYYW